MEVESPTENLLRQLSATPPKFNTGAPNVSPVLFAPHQDKDDNYTQLSSTPPKDLGGSSSSLMPERSPQPLNPKAARAAAATEAADGLFSSNNPYMFGPAAPTTSRGLLLSAKACAEAGVPKSTQYHDNWGWKWAVRFAQEHDVPVMRPRLI